MRSDQPLHKQSRATGCLMHETSHRPLPLLPGSLLAVAVGASIAEPRPKGARWEVQAAAQRSHAAQRRGGARPRSLVGGRPRSLVGGRPRSLVGGGAAEGFCCGTARAVALAVTVRNPWRVSRHGQEEEEERRECESEAGHGSIQAARSASSRGK